MRPSLTVRGGKLELKLGELTLTSNVNISPDRFNHVAAAYDGSQVKMYIDGRPDASASFSDTPPTNTQPLFIGQRGDNTDFFQGMIDEVEIFNRALTAEEIASIYNAGRAGKIKPRIALNPANGHVYEVVFGPEPFPWDVAKDEAAKRTFGGRQEHLATITSQQENDFIFASFQEVGDGCCWLGGHQPGDTPAQDPDPAAGWQWVTGEPFTYTNWAPGEPNDAGGQEDILTFHPQHPGKWNDVPGAGKAGGYLVEFEPAPTPAPSGAWTTKAPVSVASNGPSVGAINGLVYAVAGWNNNQGSALRVYDPATNTWTEKAPRPNIGSDKSHGAIKGVLYEAGGTDCCVVVNSVFAYDPATNSWSTKAAMPTKRSRAASGVIGDKLYVAGGHDFSGNTLVLKANLETYDSASNSWTTLAAMPTARSAAGAGVVNGILYVVGGAIGTSATTPVDTVEAYDPATNTWSTKAPMPTPRHMVGVAVIGNILYAIGGHGPNSGNFVTTVEAYDPATNTWSTKETMPTPRAHFGIAEVGGTIYVIGGDAAAGVINTVEAFTP